MTSPVPNAIFVFDIDGTIVPHGDFEHKWDGKKGLIGAMKAEITKGNQIWVSTANTGYNKNTLMAFFKDTEIVAADIEFMNPQIMKGIMDKRTDKNAQPPSSDFDGSKNDNIHQKGLKPFAIRELANQKFTPDKSADIKIYLFDDTPNRKDLTVNSNKCKITFHYVESFEKGRPNDLLNQFNEAAKTATVKPTPAPVVPKDSEPVPAAAPTVKEPVVPAAAPTVKEPVVPAAAPAVPAVQAAAPAVKEAPEKEPVPAVKAASPAVPALQAAAANVEEVPVIVSTEDISLTPFKFESETGKSDDVWAFYRCLMRGFLLATYEQELETINANPSRNTGENDNNRLIIIGQIGRLLRGMNKSVLHVDNVFQFDEFAITECDLIVGMLTRVSRWFKHKVELDVPRQYFSDIDTSKVALESSADYFVHQIDMAFKDLKHNKSDPAIPPIVVKDLDDFIFHLTPDMNNVGRSKVLHAYDTVRGSISAEKVRAVAGNVTRKVRVVIDKTKQAGNTAVEGVKKFTRGRKIAYREWDANRQRVKAEKADQALAAIKAKQPPVGQSGGAPSKKGLDLLYPLKQYRELRRATGEIEVMQNPNMTAVEYFEKLPVMLTRTGDAGNDQVFPALFGHPLLLYLPFARAFGCVIEVYSRPSPDDTDPVLKYLFPSKSEIANSAIRMPTIRIMDDNPYSADPNLIEILSYPNFLTHQDQYLANFSLFLPSNANDVADNAVKYLANKVKLSYQMQANGDKLQQFKDRYTIADAKYKEADSLMVQAKETKEKAQVAYTAAKRKYDTDKNAGDLPANADAKAQSARDANKTEFKKTKKVFVKEWEVYNTAISTRNAAFKRFIVTQNRLKDMVSKINSQKAENDTTADAARQSVIAALPNYKVPTPFVKQTTPITVKSAPVASPVTPVVSPIAAPVTEAPPSVTASSPVTEAPPSIIAAPPSVTEAPPSVIAAPPTVAAPPTPTVAVAPVAAKQSKQIKIMTFNVCWEALAADKPSPPNPPEFTKHCMVAGVNQCKTNIRDAILDKMEDGNYVILLQEFSSRFDDFFNGKGSISDNQVDTKICKIFSYTLTGSSKKFHVYSVTPGGETITTICPMDIFPSRADRCFMGNLMGSPFTNSYDSKTGEAIVSWTLMSGSRPYIVLIFNAQRLILINVHSNHNTAFSESGGKPYTATQLAEMNRLNKQYGNNMQQYAFTELKKMLEKEIPTEFKTYHTIIGGDFNSVTEERSKQMLEFLGMNIANVNTNNTFKHSDPTCSSNAMTLYTSVDDHIYSNDLKFVEYSVHSVDSVEKDTNGKFLFSDHLPVYATIEIPS